MYRWWGYVVASSGCSGGMLNFQQLSINGNTGFSVASREKLTKTNFFYKNACNIPSRGIQ